MQKNSLLPGRPSLSGTRNSNLNLLARHGQVGVANSTSGRGGQTMKDLVKFCITHLRPRVVEDVSIEWQGKQFDPGPLNIVLDDAVDTHNRGTLDYAALRAEAEFHVFLTFPEFVDTLEQLGADPELTEPVHGLIHSKGGIRGDHGFVLSGPCDLRPHALL